MQKTSVTVPSFAKINWILKVGDRRKDGFHDICTVFQTVSLRDTLTFSPANSLKLHCSDPLLETGPENLVLRAAAALKDRFSVEFGARIALEKNIPFPGGLGGGSSNAAAALVGLSCLWDLRPSEKELLEIASELGSDVPFFLCGGTALGTGRGTVIEEVPEIVNEFLLIAAPRVDVPTRTAFEMLDRARLTKERPKFILNVCRELAEALVSGHVVPENDFETAVFELAPEVKRTRDILLLSGASSALLAGSGASVFGIFDSDEDRRAAIESLKGEPGLRTYPVRTISRSRFRDEMGPCRFLLPKKFS